MPLSAPLLEWYVREARDLPWRRTRDPYAVLVSEVMLQQTQVARVVPRYLAWMERWPDVFALAEAPVAEVLSEWVGLGYNRRALRLREACAVVAEHGWPEDLRDLPGIGPYTAAAVGAFAFGRHELPVDTNVRRVLERTGWTPADAPPELGQAVMELGAMVCRAREAACDRCPVRDGCASAHAVVVVPRRRTGESGAQRFEDSNRWVRGRVVEALATGGSLPDGIEPERLRLAVEGLLRDGLVERVGGELRLPA